jgi:hypothetical protein
MNTLKHLLNILILLAFISCKKSATDPETIKEGNKSTTISTNTAKLGKIIDLRKYKPAKVKFKYVFIDNSGENERITVPGPSDGYLEAVLYFDKTTLIKLQADYALLSVNFIQAKKEKYNFNWLDQDIQKELQNAELELNNPDSLISEYHAELFHPRGLRGQFVMVNDKVLLRLSTTSTDVITTKKVRQPYPFDTILSGGYNISYSADDSIQRLFLKKDKLVKEISSTSYGLPYINLGYLKADFKNHFILIHTFGSGNSDFIELIEKKTGNTILSGFHIDEDTVRSFCYMDKLIL